MATTRLSIRVAPRFRQRIRARAASVGKRESDVVRRALEEYLTNDRDRETCFELAESIGLIGMLKEAPRDLSTHPRHFKGFGR